MFCSICESIHDISLMEEERETIIKGEKIKYKELYYKCPKYQNNNIFMSGDLWNINLQGNTIAALKDSFSNYYRKNISLDQNDIMFNSGVMLIDMDKWRQNKIKERFINFKRNKRNKRKISINTK